MPNIDLSVSPGQTKQLTFNCANTYTPENIVFNITASGGDANTDYVIQCETAANQRLKQGTSVTSYTPTAGIHLIHIKNANSYTSNSLYGQFNGVPSNTTTPIYINGSVSSSSNRTLPAGLYAAYYDGTRWHFRTDGKIDFGSSGFLKADGSVDTNTYTSNTGTVTSVGLSNATNGGLTISGSPITTSGTITVGHTNSVTAGTNVGNNTTTSLSHGGTFSVPYFSYDVNGHITSASTKTLTLPSAGGGSDNTFRVDFTSNGGTISCNHTIAEIYSAYTGGKIILGSFGNTGGSMNLLLHNCSSTTVQFLIVETIGGAVIRGIHSGNTDVWSSIDKTNFYTVFFSDSDDGNGQYTSSISFAEIADAINRIEPIIVGRLCGYSNVRDYVLTFHDFDSNISTHTIKFTSYENATIYEMVGEAIYSNGSYSNETWEEYVFLLSSGGGGGGENYYPTAMSWTNGTSSGPTATITMSGTSNISVGAIPSANGTTTSGIVTTDAQDFGGVKTFLSEPKIKVGTIKVANNNTTYYTQTFPKQNGTVVNGTGTNGYLAKWTGANTIAKGPQLGSSTTTFLRNDGQWATPAGGGGGGSTVVAINPDGITAGYKAGGVNIDGTATEFIVTPARIVDATAPSSYNVARQGVVRPQVEIDATGWFDTNYLNVGLSMSWDNVQEIRIGSPDSLMGGGESVLFIPITCIYRYNSTTGRNESIPGILVRCTDSTDALGPYFESTMGMIINRRE